MSLWDKQSLGELVEILSGFAFDSNQFADSGEMPIIRIRDIIPGYSSTFYIGDYDPKYVIQDGDILIGMDGEFNRARWRGGKALLNQRVCRISVSNQNLDEGYLFHFLPNALKAIEDATPFVTVKHLSVKNIRDIEIPLPPLPVQKKIADILDRAEALRAKRRSALAQFDELTQSIFIEMFGDPVKNPKNWSIEKVQDVMSQIEAGWSANGESRPREKNEYAVLKVSAVTQGVFLPEECKVINNDIEFKKVVTPEKGDVLFSRANTLELVGASCLIRENYPYLLLPDKLWKIRVNEEKICPEYFKFVLSYPTVRNEISKLSTGTSGSMYNISMDKFRLIKITVPPIPLQCEFAHNIASIEKLKAAYKASIAELDELFASLQYRAFKGEL